MTKTNRKWLYIQNNQEELLMRTEITEPEGEIQVPLVGKAVYKMSGGQVKISSKTNCKIHCFTDGDVLVRSPKRGLRPTSSFFPRVLIFGSFLVGVLGLSFSSNVFNLTFATPKREIQVVVTPVPTIVPTVTPTVIPTVPPSPKVKSKPKKAQVRTQVKALGLGKMEEHEKNARKAFLRGDLSQASFDLAEAKANGGKLSTDFVQFESELEYAICKQSYGNSEWETATQHCQTALLRIKNERAKKILGQLALRTKRLYLEGYAMEGLNTKAAIARYKDALRSAGAGDPYGEKASKKLKVIGVVSSH